MDPLLEFPSSNQINQKTLGFPKCWMWFEQPSFRDISRAKLVPVMCLDRSYLNKNPDLCFAKLVVNKLIIAHLLHHIGCAQHNMYNRVNRGTLGTNWEVNFQKNTPCGYHVPVVIGWVWSKNDTYIYVPTKTAIIGRYIPFSDTPK